MERKRPANVAAPNDEVKTAAQQARRPAEVASDDRLAGPLVGVRVLDVSRHLAGPHAAMVLGDLGAEVIKVEMPVRGDDARTWPPFHDGESCYFMSVNRNKRSMELDLGDPSMRASIRALVERSDVLIENFRPGTLDRWGLTDAELSTWNPRLVRCSISAFGPSGSGRERPGMDLMLQAASGLMSITGEEGRPPVRVGISLVDLIAGADAVQGILAALLHRAISGRGQRVDVALFDGTLAWLSYHVTSFLMTGEVPRRMGASHPSVAPYGAYATTDGFLILAVATDALWGRLCQALDRTDLFADPRFVSNRARCQDRQALDEELDKTFGSRSAAVWAEILGQAGIPCSPVLDVAEVLDDPIVEERGLIVRSRRTDGTEIPAPAIPIRFSETPGSIRRPPPLLGEHTLEIDRELEGSEFR
ncbi:MAG: CoA transferase [Actinomycetota bacterium]